MSSTLAEAISAAIVELHTELYDDDRAEATTFIDDNLVVCALKEGEGSGSQDHSEAEFTAAIERLTHRRVTASLSGYQTTSGVACEVFLLEGPPVVSV